MKKLLFIAVAALLYACGGGEHTHDHANHDHGDENATPVAQTVSYGEAFDTTGATPIAMVSQQLAESGSVEGVYKAKIVESCQKMGCWMSIESPDQESMMVFMNDHSFFVPKQGVNGLDCYVTGQAYYDTLSVDFQKHLLEDANAPQEEIDAITEDKYEMAFNAMGVVIEDYVPSEEEGEGEEHDHEGHDHEGHDQDHDGHDHDHGAEGEE